MGQSKIGAKLGEAVDTDGKVTAELNMDSPTLLNNTVIALRSGFLAKVSYLLTDGTGETQTDYGFQRSAHDWILDPNRRMVEPGVFSKDITALAEELGANPLVAGDPVWVRKLLSTVVALFGTGNSVFRWCLIQKSNPYINGTHAQFLGETLEFIGGGRRTTAVQTYRRFIKKVNDFTNNQAMSATIDKYFVTTQHFNRRVPRDMTDFLVMWMSRENGVADMLITLEVIFGMGSDKRNR